MYQSSQENKDIKPAIVVVAYDREKALDRLLTSLGNADYEGFIDVPLIISIDKSGNEAVGKLADSFS